jgi:hypothetical protein
MFEQAHKFSFFLNFSNVIAKKAKSFGFFLSAIRVAVRVFKFQLPEKEFCISIVFRFCLQMLLVTGKPMQKLLNSHTILETIPKPLCFAHIRTT